MHKELISILKCKKCGNSPLNLVRVEEDAIEIVAGTLSCTRCGSVYAVVEGVPNMIEGESITELRTAKEEEDTRTALNDEWLLSLPTPSIHPADTTFEHKEGDKALNFYDMLERMALTGAETVLELGAGNCWATNIFTQKGCRCVASDVRMRRYYGLRSGRIFIESNGRYFERILSNLDHPPFVEEAFDLVFAQSSFQYVEDLSKCLSEIYSILRPGGRLVLSYSGVYGLLKKKGVDCPGYHFSRLKKALKNAGFEGSPIFPVYLEKHFSHGVLKGKRFYHIGQVFSVFWRRVPFFQTVIKNYGLYLMILLFGVPVNLIAKKP